MQLLGYEPLLSEGKLAYLKLNRETPCPPRGAVPVNQGRGGEFFTQHARFAFGHRGDSSGYVERVNNSMRRWLQFLFLLCTASAHAQLAVTVSPPRITGSKAVVPLALKNNLAEKVESARAVVFLLDEQGKMAGQAARWVIGGTGTNGLAPGATNAYYFVIPANRPFATTNLTARVNFTRVVLEGGKVVEPAKALSVSDQAPSSPSNR